MALDIVFANAGINGVWRRSRKLRRKSGIKRSTSTSKALFSAIKYAVPHLKKQGGAIVVTSSVNGTRVFSNSDATAYSCAKAGQLVMAKMLAPESAPHGVRINAICPGLVRTNIIENTHQRNRDAIRWPVLFPQGAIPLTGKNRPRRTKWRNLCFSSSRTTQRTSPAPNCGLTAGSRWCWDKLIYDF